MSSERTEHGLVIGKFLPPHSGHHLLIRSAAAAAERVTVVVMAATVEPVPLARRVEWLREVHRAEPRVTVVGIVDDVPVDYDDPAIWDQHMALVDEALVSAGAGRVTAVFTSEPYGEEMARRLGATNVVLDHARVLEPLSATSVRDDTVGRWEHLAAPIRAGLALRVALIGAESTGKTTLSRALTDALRARGGAHGLTRWVEEHGRPYTIDKLGAAIAKAAVRGERRPTMEELVWSSDEFVTIARRQNELEDAAAAIGGPVLVCDTDAFATAIWHERYIGSRHPGLDALARRHPLYLLTHHDDVPFEQDGIRDGEAVRAWMTERFLGEIAASGRDVVVLRGSHQERMGTALASIDAMLALPFEERPWIRA